MLELIDSITEHLEAIDDELQLALGVESSIVTKGYLRRKIAGVKADLLTARTELADLRVMADVGVGVKG